MASFLSDDTVAWPLLNSASPWATTKEDLLALLTCPYTIAVTTRTSTLEGFPNNDAIHQHCFFDPNTHQPHTDPSVPASTLNTLGYSPIPLDQYLDFLTEIYSALHAPTQPPRSKKPFILSVTGSAADIVECAHRVVACSASLDHYPLLMEVNLSCPNIAGQPPPAYSRAALTDYLRALQTHPAIQQCKLHEDGGGAGGFGPALGSADGTGIGGMAGSALHALALGNVARLRAMLDSHESLKQIQIIGVGGVSDGEGCRRMRAAGASAVAVATALGSIGTDVFERIATGNIVGKG
ncbi:hypothetical protein FH972_022108 [Carpinus fangiana]|uniref:Dihydroorotate dehydrogenase catalytic domain-containing protein n=1 Tax=Carpinus fangiana TaxID=176857 RepID=A0A5N6KRT8_9ROSI|nr:hypothetical protein FH972_022108 [Carpinus fangiana]